MPLLEKAFTATVSVLGERHSATGDILVEYGAVLADLGRDDEGLERMREGFAVHRTIHGRGFPATLRSADLVGHQLVKMGRYAEARNLYAESLANLEKVVGPDSPHLYSTLFNLGNSAAGCGDLVAGLSHHRRALDLLEQGEEANPSYLQQSREAIADLLARTDSPAIER
ncbi:MAG: tetratricopeptide repeat protein [Planctomycetota bacterium]